MAGASPKKGGMRSCCAKADCTGGYTGICNRLDAVKINRPGVGLRYCSVVALLDLREQAANMTGVHAVDLGQTGEIERIELSKIL